MNLTPSVLALFFALSGAGPAHFGEEPPAQTPVENASGEQKTAPNQTAANSLADFAKPMVAEHTDVQSGTDEPTQPAPTQPSVAESSSKKPSAKLVPSVSGTSSEATPTKVANPRQVEEHILPNGLRVLIAQDQSLPVAAVTLAIDVGTSDDPEKYPGLVQVLAYHLQQGNRELRPGAAMAMAHDVGGLSEMAIGPAQVRFESLVPQAALMRMIWVEAQRLRAPTMNDALWRKSISYAKRDQPARASIPPSVFAKVWNDPSLDHDGRRLSPEQLEVLAKIPGPEASSWLSRLFVYSRATLVVVSPLAKDEVLQSIQLQFSDLPSASRDIGKASVSFGAGQSHAQQSLQARGYRGQTFVWPVPSNAASVLWAQVVCDSVNRRAKKLRSRRSRSNASELRNVRCALQANASRSVMVLRAKGAKQPQAVLDLLQREWGEGKFQSEMDRRRKIRTRRWQTYLDSPLNLATHLARFSPGTFSPNRVDDPTGEFSLTDPNGWQRYLPNLFDRQRAVRVMRPSSAPEPVSIQTTTEDSSSDSVPASAKPAYQTIQRTERVQKIKNSGGQPKTSQGGAER